MLVLLLTTFLILQSAVSSLTDEPIYLVTVTSQIVGGSSETLCGQIHLVKEPLSFTVALEMMEGRNITLLQESVTTEFHRCIQFQVPPVVRDTVANIHAVVQWGQKYLSKKTKIQISTVTSFIMVQTDKLIYKPGQTVNFRILSLDSSLASYDQVHRAVELRDPQGNQIAQWLNQSTTSGILDMSYPTTTQSKQGVYMISIWTENGLLYPYTFEIKKYILPKFEVKVHLPDFITSLDTEVTVKTCGRYSYGKAVLGLVNTEVFCSVELRLWRRSLRINISRTDETGCATYVFKLGEACRLSSDPVGIVTVESTIEEDGTGVVSRGNARLKFDFSSINLDFEDVHSYYKPGMDYEGKILVKKIDPSAGPSISVYLYSFSAKRDNWTLTCDSKGVAHFSLDTSSWGMQTVHLQARLSPWESVNIDAVYGRKYRTAFHEVKPFFSKSKSFLKIMQAKERLPCDEDAQVVVRYIIQGVELSGQKDLDFFYLVLSKGRMLRHGRSRVTLSDGEVKRGEMSLTLQRMAELAPFAQVVVYVVLPNREIVADSYDFAIQYCFSNKVSLRFSSAQERPRGKVSLELQAQPGSLCSLRVVDQSVILKRPDQELSAQRVYNKLPFERLNGYLFQLDDGEPPPCTSPDKRPVRSVTTESAAYSVFERVSIKALTNVVMKAPINCEQGQRDGGLCPIVPFPSPHKLEDTIRTYFPETWIWELVPVGDSGSVNLERIVPDTITRWTASAFCTSSAGFGLAANTGLTAFQPFFVSLTLPNSIIRGEVFVLKATVFNYLSKCIMVEVSLSESTQFTAQPCDGCQYRRRLYGKNSETFSWILSTTTLGEVSIKVSAEALSTKDLCGNEVVTVPDEGRIDTVVRTLLVEPEGTEQSFSHNALLCPREGAVEKAVSLELPKAFVEGSAKASVSVLGDLMGHAVRNLDSLLAMPNNWGEQNMVGFAPNIFILRYLESTGQLTTEIRDKAVTLMKTGYQQELNYRHMDGSFSAFGENDPSGNTWLTAFVMKSFGSATPYIFIDPNDITQAKEWLSLQQQQDGCITSVGKLHNVWMKGGVRDEVMLTAYVTAAVLELDRNIFDPLVHKSLSCLKLATDQFNSTYATALLAYTFTLAGDHDVRVRLIRQLDSAVKITGDGRYWEHAGACGRDSLSVEMTSYVLLALLSGPPLPGFDLNYSASIVRWLAQQQNPYGGFASTQDTVVALQALTLYSAATYSPGGSSTVTVSTTGGYKRQFSVDQKNRLQYQEEQLQEVPRVYSIKAEGESCVFVQFTLRYNISPPPASSAFHVKARALGHCRSTEKPSLLVTLDVSYHGTGKETNMVIVTFHLLSGFVLDKTSLNFLKADPAVKRIEEEGHVIIHLAKLKRMEPRSYAMVIVEDVPVRNLKPAVVKVYDYYRRCDEAVSEYRSPCAQGDQLN